MYFDGAGVPRTYTGKTEMSYRCRILIPHLMLAVFLCLPAFSEGNIGVTYHRGTFDGSRWGVRGDSDVRTAGVWEYIGLDIDGHLQFGDVYTGNIETGLTLSSLGLGVRLYSANTFKGDALDTLGRDHRIGGAFVLPIGERLWSIGLFGKNGTASASTSHGLSIKAGRSLNVGISTEWNISRLELEVKGALELRGKGISVHQLITEIRTHGKLFWRLRWHLRSTLATQLYGEQIETEISNTLAIGYLF